MKLLLINACSNKNSKTLKLTKEIINIKILIIIYQGC